MSSAETDRLGALRERIAAVDARFVEALNERIELVAELQRHKAAHGLPFLDPGRERWLLDEAARLNRGPASDDAVRELVAHVLDLVKRELPPEERSAR